MLSSARNFITTAQCGLTLASLNQVQHTPRASTSLVGKPVRGAWSQGSLSLSAASGTADAVRGKRCACGTNVVTRSGASLRHLPSVLRDLEGMLDSGGIEAFFLRRHAKAGLHYVCLPSDRVHGSRHVSLSPVDLSITANILGPPDAP